MKRSFPTLSLCKKLTEVWFPDTVNMLWTHWVIDTTTDYSWYQWEEWYKCPTVYELLNVLPNKIEFEVPLFLHMNKNEDWWTVEYICSYKYNSPTSIKINWELPDILSEMYLILKKWNNI